MDTTPLNESTLKVALSGRMDVNGVNDTESGLTSTAASAGKDIVIDMSDVSFVASLGIRMFVSTARAQMANGKRLVLFGCQPPVAEVFGMAALDSLFKVTTDEASALAELG